MAEHVTAGEFERWMQRLSQENRDILAEQRKTNGRVTAVETELKVAKKVTAVISGAISLVIAVGGFILHLIKW